ncbi:MAG: S-layer homology domain-containing protein, partial [Oscillospiraceae bacterium]|nr:S-layer homology domain-containing protein [Oscillospiraceae bacterium]
QPIGAENLVAWLAMYDATTGTGDPNLGLMLPLQNGTVTLELTALAAAVGEDFDYTLNFYDTVTGSLVASASGTITVSAAQPNTYTVTYDDDQGNTVPVTENVGTNHTVLDFSDASLGFTAPAGQVFDYWSGDDGNDYDPADTVSTAITLTAVYTTAPQSFTVTYNYLEAFIAVVIPEAAGSTHTVLSYNDPFLNFLPPAGHTFDCWLDLSGQSYNAGDPITTNVSLTAIWKVIPIVNADTPVITPQPIGATYDQFDTAVALIVDATVTDNGTITFEWFDGSGASVGFGDTYTPDTTTLGVFTYYAEATNTIPDNGDGGSKTATATSNAATIIVIDPTKENAELPVINPQPFGDTYLVNETPTDLIVGATIVSTASSLSYQWYENTINSNTGGTVIAGATGTSLTPSTSTVGTFYYYAVVTNMLDVDNGDGGIKSISLPSDVAIVVVYQINALAPIVAGPTDVMVNTGGAANLSVIAGSQDGGTLTYQWYSNTTASNSGGTLIAGATSASYVPDTTFDGTFYYYVVVTNTIVDNGDGGIKAVSKTSQVATVIVNPLVNAQQPIITNQPSNVTVTVNNAANLSVTAISPDGGTLSYQWYRNTTASYIGGTLITGATNTSYTPDTSVVGTFYYYVVVTNTNTTATGNQTASVDSYFVTVTVSRLSGGGSYTGGGTPSVDDDEIDEIITPLAESHTPYIQGYPDGTIRPDNNITRAEVAMIIWRLLPANAQSTNSSGTFSDVANGAWYAVAINRLASLGILRGYTDGTFRPDAPITREEFTAIVCRFFDVAIDSSENPFSDVSENWAYEYILTAAANGWVEGYPDGTFRPKNDIKRAEVVTIINRIIGRIVRTENIPDEYYGTFSDLQRSHWAFQDMLEAGVPHSFTIGEDNTEIWSASSDVDELEDAA